MKKIAVFFKTPGEKSYPFDKEEYWNAYNELAEEIESQGAEFFVVRGQDSYLGNGCFSNSWKLSGGKQYESGELQTNAIYDKGSLVHDETVPVLNNSQVNRVCTDKWETYQLLREYSPVTFLVNNQVELQQKVSLIASERIVIKPLDGEEGKDVYVIKPQEISTLSLNFPVLLQEFIDSSEGVPGLIEGVHDYRIALLDGEVVYSFLRTPPKGELKANVALGGTLLMVTPPEIPPVFMELALAVDKKMAQFGTRLYGVDMALERGVPKIIELNSRLGLQGNDRHPTFKVFKHLLAQKLLSMAT